MVLNTYIQTGIGRIPLKDFLEIKAGDAGYPSYRVAYENGFRAKGYEDVTPEDLYG